MILRQFLHRDPVAISYVPGCGNATSTIGFVERNNRALPIEAEEEFVK